MEWALLKPSLDFSHGRERLESLDFDVHNYSRETLVDLAVEIFRKVAFDFTWQFFVAELSFLNSPSSILALESS
jgi:hypothetical protein